MPFLQNKRKAPTDLTEKKPQPLSLQQAAVCFCWMIRGTEYDIAGLLPDNDSAIGSDDLYERFITGPVYIKWIVQRHTIKRLIIAVYSVKVPPR